MSILHRDRFVTSAAHARQLPPAGPPEVCIVGRSTVGRSSAITVLTNQRRSAHASKTPGRTRLINSFGLPDPLHPDDYLGFLVDLPCYGYAAVDKAQKQQWDALIGTYLQQRSSIAGIVLLIDIRRGLTELDLQLAHWIAPTQKPVLILATKADKLAYGRSEEHTSELQSRGHLVYRLL